MQVLRPLAVFAVLLLAHPLGAQDSTAYRRASNGTRVLENDGGVSIKVLVESAVLGGGGVEVAEATFPVGMGAGPASHRHGSTEMLYVISGELDHVVNGETHRLTAGMMGLVKPADTVIHRVVGQTPVKVLLIWAPGGEVERLARVFRERR
jgi:quercetin dioxygenase-like cupin family protein